MSSESGILADHLNEDNLNDDHHHDRVINFNDRVTEEDLKQNSSSPELLDNDKPTQPYIQKNIKKT